MESLDLNLSFLDGFVQQQMAEGKPQYDPSKRQASTPVDEDTTQGLIFTPYQQAQFGVTKHSQTLQESNPLIMSSGGGQAASVNTGAAAPFNVTGVNPAAGALPGAAPNNATLAVGNVKRIWGAQSSEEVKAPEIAPSSTAAGVSQQAPQPASGAIN